MDLRAGLLYVVATPIGNLEDITLRALRVLAEVDWIAAEDTRHTRKLLTHHGIHTKILSYRDRNHKSIAKHLLELLKSGKDMALVSDAGMPGISDPGRALVAEAVQNGMSVVPVPGPCAAVCALAASGLSTERFLFVGFLPRKPGELKRLLEELTGETGTLVFYESPNRVGKTLKAMTEIYGDRQAVVARELTKLHERFHRGTLRELAGHFAQDVKGEVTLLVEGERGRKIQLGPEAKAAVEALRCGRSLSSKEVARLVAKLTGLERNALYRLAVNCPDAETGEQEVKGG